MRPYLVILFSFAALCPAAVPSEAPPGYHDQRFGPWGGVVFVPDGWTYREPAGPNGGLYIIAKDVAADGSYDTGMRIQFIGGVKKRTGLTPTEAVATNIRVRRRTETVLSECAPEQSGIFTRICIETTGRPAKAKPNQEYHIISSFWWNDEMDIMAAVIFGAPVEQWDAVKSIYAISGNVKIYDADWIDAHSAKSRPTQAAKAEPAAAAAAVEEPPRDAELDSTAKYNTIQFVNRMSDLPWRLGPNPAALMTTLEMMRRIIADQVKSTHMAKPAVTNVVVGIAPKGRLRVWLIDWEPVMPADQIRALTQRLETVSPPQVRNGPVALNITVELNGAAAGTVVPSKLHLPDEWTTALKGQSVVLPDGLPDAIWDQHAAVR